MKLLRALLTVLIGCFIILPLLFIASYILIVTGFLERITIKSNYSIRIAKYLGDDSAELLKIISGSEPKQ
jgi:hypothetical protein